MDLMVRTGTKPGREARCAVCLHGFETPVQSDRVNTQ